MNLNQTIQAILTPTGVPVTFRNYIGKANTYITYFCYNEQGEAWAENEEIATGYYVQVDVWSKEDYIALVENTKALMIAAGFKRTTAQDLYEAEERIYHKALRFSHVD